MQNTLAISVIRIDVSLNKGLSGLLDLVSQAVLMWVAEGCTGMVLSRAVCLWRGVFLLF